MDLNIPGGPRYDGRLNRETAEWWRDQIKRLCSHGNVSDAVALFAEFEVKNSIHEWFEMIRIERIRLSDGQSPGEG